VRCVAAAGTVPVSAADVSLWLPLGIGGDMSAVPEPTPQKWRSPIPAITRFDERMFKTWRVRRVAIIVRILLIGVVVGLLVARWANG
jgi:hypothetical protein